MKAYQGVDKDNKRELIGTGKDAEDYIKWYFQQKYPNDKLINDFISVTYDYADDNTKEELEGWFFSSGDWSVVEVDN